MIWVEVFSENFLIPYTYEYKYITAKYIEELRWFLTIPILVITQILVFAWTFWILDLDVFVNDRRNTSASYLPTWGFLMHRCMSLKASFSQLLYLQSSRFTIIHLYLLQLTSRGPNFNHQPAPLVWRFSKPNADSVKFS